MAIHTKLYKRSKSPYWQIRYKDNGVTKRDSTGCEKRKDALLYQDNLIKRLKLNEGIIGVDDLTLKNLMDKVVIDYKLNGQKYNRVEQAAKHLYSYFGENRTITSITADDIDNYKLEKIKKIKPATLNRTLSVFMRGLNLMNIRLGYKIKLLQENNIRKNFLEYWQYLKLLEHASPHIVNLIKLMYKTGWRINELKTLKWNQIDLNEGTIYLAPQTTKNDDGRYYYMDNEIKDMMQDMWNAHTVLTPNIDNVFLGKDGKTPIKDFRWAWKNSCKRAGLEEFHCHDCRRSAARNLIRAGVPQRIAQSLLGHRTAQIFSRYNIVSPLDLKEAAQKQAKYLKSLTIHGEDNVVQIGAGSLDHPEHLEEPEPIEE